MKRSLIILPLALTLFGAGCGTKTAPVAPQDQDQQAANANPGETSTVLAMQKFTDDTFGFAFTYPADWKLEGTNDIVFHNLGPNRSTTGAGDTLTVGRIEGTSATVDDAAAGISRVFFNEITKEWMIAQNNAKGEFESKNAKPDYVTLSGLPVFKVHGKQATVIVPLTHKRFIVVNMNGSAWTGALEPFVKTIRTPSDKLKAEELSAAVKTMLESEDIKP